MRLFRVAVPVSDIARARHFYEALLSMEADATVPSRLYFHCDGSILVAVDWGVEGSGPLRPNLEHVYLSTDDLEATHARARAAGADIVSSPAVRPWGERSFYCADPDGNPLCFVDQDTLFLGRGASWR